MKYLYIATAGAVFALALFADWFIRTFSLPLAVLFAIGIGGCVLDVLDPPGVNSSWEPTRSGMMRRRVCGVVEEREMTDEERADYWSREAL